MQQRGSGSGRGGETRGASVTRRIGPVDWARLRAQKLSLIEQLADDDPAWDIVHLIDDIQDGAAKVLGELLVFGPHHDDGDGEPGGASPGSEAAS